MSCVTPFRPRRCLPILPKPDARILSHTPPAPATADHGANLPGADLATPTLAGEVRLPLATTRLRVHLRIQSIAAYGGAACLVVDLPAP